MTRFRSPVAYAIALFALLVAVLLRWQLIPWLGSQLPFVTLFGAVAVAAWAGGYRPATLVTLLGYAASSYLFIEPLYQWPRLDAKNVVGLLSYAFTCGVIIVIGQAMRAAQSRAAERGELLRVTLASIGDAVITTDKDGRVTYLNAAAQDLTGWSSTEVAGRPLENIFRIVNERTREPVSNPVLRALREGMVVGLANHTVLIGKDGSERPIEDSAAPIRDAAGDIVGGVLIFRDVSERLRLEKAATERQLIDRRLAAIVESSEDAIVGKTLDGIIQSWNAGAQRLFGHSTEEAVGRHISLIIPPDRLHEEDEIIARLKARQRVEHFQTERVRKDGQRVHVSLTVSPIIAADGSVIGASKIARDVGEQRRLESELRKLAADLSDADRRKNEFLATLAHELRNPMAPLRNMLEVLDRAGDNEVTRRHAVEVMHRQLRRMSRLVDDLLDVNRIALGRLELRKERVEVASVIEQAKESCTPMASSLGQTLVARVPAEPIFVLGDEVRLVQVLSNLLNNGCKYTNTGGLIEIDAARDAHEVVITVRDNGIGIPTDRLQDIFHMFTQLEPSTERSQGGLGIGLMLVKQIVELHGGTVHARSKGAGLGSEFTVRLPTIEAEAGVSMLAEQGDRLAS